MMRERRVTARPAPKQKARQVASQPVADANEPTSEIGINTACPRKEASAVINPTNKMGAVGVRYSLWIVASRPSSIRRRPIANNSRVEVMKLPLNIFSNDSNTASMMISTSSREPKARSNATAVAKRSSASDCQGCSRVTTAMTTT